MQVGINRRFFVINHEGDKNRQTGMLFVNPQVVGSSEESRRLLEACISLPDIEGRVKRNIWVDVKAICVDYKYLSSGVGTDHFAETSIRLHEKQAQIFQHELDHLDGVLFVDRLYQLRDKKAARAKLAKLERTAIL